jgi:hypothetical protein
VLFLAPILFAPALILVREWVYPRVHLCKLQKMQGFQEKSAHGSENRALEIVSVQWDADSFAIG